MHVIGIMGGVASGKSMVARQLAQYGAGLLDADRVGHEVLRQPQIETAVRARWGNEVFGPDGRIDRWRLARIVFAGPPEGPRERKYLEQLTHPEIGRCLSQQVAQAKAEGRPAVILDAALLLEAGWDKLCDKMVFVDVPREIRLSRARERGWSEKEFTAREGAQESLDFKRRRADVVVDNSGSPEQTAAQVERFWRSLVD